MIYTDRCRSYCIVSMHRRLVIALAVIVLLPISAMIPAYAHFEHLGHYNNRGGHIGPYYAYEALEPDYAGPNEPVAVMFSVQDQIGRASCREKSVDLGGRRIIKKKKA